MAKPFKRKNKDGSFSYRISPSRVVDGKLERVVKTFSSYQMAKDWEEKKLKEWELEDLHGKYNNDTVGSVIQQYMNKFCGNFGRTKNYDLIKLQKSNLANIPVSKLNAKAIIDHCIERNKTVKPQTVIGDITWLRIAIKTMCAINGQQFNSMPFDNAHTVLINEKLIARSAKRDRLPTLREIIDICKYFDSKPKSEIPMKDITLFALFSARRLEEITRIQWDDNNNDKLTGMVRDVKDPRNKKGNHMRFKYDSCAWRIVQRQPKNSEYIFPYNHKTIGEYFRIACVNLNIHNLHFHDLRHAAVTRLFKKKLPIDKVRHYTLHKNLSQLMRYNQERSVTLGIFSRKIPPIPRKNWCLNRIVLPL